MAIVKPGVPMEIVLNKWVFVTLPLTTQLLFTLPMLYVDRYYSSKRSKFTMALMRRPTEAWAVCILGWYWHISPWWNESIWGDISGVSISNPMAWTCLKVSDAQETPTWADKAQVWNCCILLSPSMIPSDFWGGRLPVTLMVTCIWSVMIPISQVALHWREQLYSYHYSCASVSDIGFNHPKYFLL